MAGPRAAVLISGGGSNLQALIDAARDARLTAEIALVVSNEPDAHGLTRAADAGITRRVIDHREHSSRDAFERALDRALREAGIEIVCLAGFMRVLTAPFVEGWRNRLLNIHPSLLPAFRGLNTHARAIEAGCRISGCTVHLVRPALDDGPILAQGVVPVLEGDDAMSLAARVLEVEHRCYPLALDLLARGSLEVRGERIIARPQAPWRLVLHPLLTAGSG